MELHEYKAKILEAIKELNNNPSFENLGTVESMIDFYSDCYKDECGIRPRNDIGYFRSLYNEEAQGLFAKWDDLPWEDHLRYMGYGK